MKKYIVSICIFFAIITVLISGCSSPDNAVSDEASTEETTETTTDEDSLKPAIDYEYAEKLSGKWSGSRGIVIFDDGNVFTAFDEEGAEYNGYYSVAASESGNMGISFAVDENNIKTYKAVFNSDNKLIFTDEYGETSEFARG